MTGELVRLNGVCKAFRGRVAVDDLSLSIDHGEVVALLGPNGAGKTTTLALMLGHVRPTRGDVLLRGVSVAGDRRRALRAVGVVVDSPAFHDYLTGWENLALLVSYAEVPDDAAMLDAVRFVGLDDRIHDRVGTYSHGMRQRLALAQALVPAPDLVLLDEPADGLDPDGVVTMHGMIARLSGERGVAVVIASHLLSEVERVCDRVLILDSGRLVFDGRWNDDTGPERFRLEIDDWACAQPIVSRAGATVGGDGAIELAPGREVADLVRALVEGGVRVSTITRIRPTLADAYRRLTAKPESGA